MRGTISTINAGVAVIEAGNGRHYLTEEITGLEVGDRVQFQATRGQALIRNVEVIGFNPAAEWEREQCQSKA
ncbi:MAG: hypothetical protein IID45_12765 [Planctomycetes bacterium]|nr:hypothetical protein [Planctomycetota bacterium]